MKRSMLLLLLLFAGLYVVLNLGGDSVGTEDTVFTEGYQNNYPYGLDIDYFVD